MRPKLSLWQRFKLLSKEFSELRRFFKSTPFEKRKIVFYSAQTQYIAYFEGMINQLIAEEATLAYITSDYDDPILTQHSPQVSSFYLNRLFPFMAPFINAKVVVLTMPDLHLLHIRRSIFDVHYIFASHSMCSLHMGINKEALNHFDTIFCNGPYHYEEILETEKLYQLKPKTLIKAGYYRLEKLYEEHQAWKAKRPFSSHTPLVVIAPSWQKENILEACGHELVQTLLNTGFDIVFRPHPMTTYRKPHLLEALAAEFGQHPNFRLDTKTESNYYLHAADLMVCDWSGVSMEYALATERPVLYIDLPPKIHNPEYEKISTPPLEMSIRLQIGNVIQLNEVPKADEFVREILANKDAYRNRIIEARQTHLYHFGKSSKISVQHILSLL